MSKERVVFRLIRMPCCGFMACWVNPRFPSFCPECGTNVFMDVKKCVLKSDDEATLEVNLS